MNNNKTAEYYVVSYRTYSASILEMVMLVEFIIFSLFFLKKENSTVEDCISHI